MSPVVKTRSTRFLKEPVHKRVGWEISTFPVDWEHLGAERLHPGDRYPATLTVMGTTPTDVRINHLPPDELRREPYLRGASGFGTWSDLNTYGVLYRYRAAGEETSASEGYATLGATMVAAIVVIANALAKYTGSTP